MEPSTHPDPPPAGPSSRELVGRALAGRYQLTHLLGRGGHGAVYHAIQHPIRRPVAVKIFMPVGTCDVARMRARFMAEAGVLAQLRHPNNTTLLDYGQDQSGVLFMVQELLDGQTLASALRGGARLGVQRAANIACQVLSALAEAHSRGVIHRDVKASNVMLIRDCAGRERVKLIDYGIARALDPHVRRVETVAGVVIGTPTYMAPEQIRQQRMTPATDLYATGVLLYVMLMGRPPYTGASALDILRQHIEGPPPMLTGVRPMMAAVIRRAMARNPSARFGRADDMLTALEVAVADAMEHRVQRRESRFRDRWPDAPATEWIPLPTGSVTWSVRKRPVLASAVPEIAPKPPRPLEAPVPVRDGLSSPGAGTGPDFAPSFSEASEVDAPPARSDWRLVGAIMAAGLTVGLSIGVYVAEPVDDTPTRIVLSAGDVPEHRSTGSLMTILAPIRRAYETAAEPTQRSAPAPEPKRDPPRRPSVDRAEEQSRASTDRKVPRRPPPAPVRRPSGNPRAKTPRVVSSPLNGAPAARRSNAEPSPDRAASELAMPALVAHEPSALDRARQIQRSATICDCKTALRIARKGPIVTVSAALRLREHCIDDGPTSCTSGGG